MNWLSEWRKAKHRSNWARMKAIECHICRDYRCLDWAEKTIREIGYDAFDLQYVQPEYERLRNNRKPVHRMVVVKLLDGTWDIKEVEE
jgi:hypothetical protein